MESRFVFSVHFCLVFCLMGLPQNNLGQVIEVELKIRFMTFARGRSVLAETFLNHFCQHG